MPPKIHSTYFDLTPFTPPFNSSKTGSKGLEPQEKLQLAKLHLHTKPLYVLWLQSRLHRLLRLHRSRCSGLVLGQRSLQFVVQAVLAVELQGPVERRILGAAAQHLAGLLSIFRATGHGRWQGVGGGQEVRHGRGTSHSMFDCAGMPYGVDVRRETKEHVVYFRLTASKSPN